MNHRWWNWRTALGGAALFHICVLSGVALQAQQKPVTAQAPIGGLPANRTGADIYLAACVTCHGPDGRGMPQPSVGFDTPLPDFTDCSFATAEADADWHSVVSRGGPIRGLDRHMPSFGEALSPADISLVIGHVRTFCTDRAKWPQGDLNFPRAFFTEKAFPENETVWTTAFTGGDEKSVSNTLVYEHRLGSRSQFEIAAPLDFLQDESGQWTKGIGDVAVAFKHAFYASMNTGAIFAAGGEVAFPSGNEAKGLGNGYFVGEVFGMYNQALPRNSFLQVHGGFEAPSDSTQPKEVYFRTAIGTTFAADRGQGRSWSPQIEVLFARPFGEPAEWDIVPQLQVSLSKLQHVLVAGGVRIPMTDRGSRSPQVVVYFLWDWFDGSVFSFWK